MPQFTTGQPIVDAIGKLSFEGNLVPHTWIKHLTYTNKRGSYTHHLAVLLLADIVYWYRPQVVVDEFSGRVLGWKKKFRDDKLQRSYEQIAQQLGATYKQAREAVIFLESLNLITTESRNFTTSSGLFVSNALYLEPVVEEISRITYSVKAEPDSEIGKRDSEIGRTYTKISPETSQNIEINTHIRQSAEEAGTYLNVVAVSGNGKEEFSQQKDEIADRVIDKRVKSTVRRREPVLAKRTPSVDKKGSAMFEKPERLKKVEDVDDLPRKPDGTPLYPWNKNGSSRHCLKFARWIFKHHLVKCTNYDEKKGFMAQKGMVLGYLDKIDWTQAETVIDYWNDYVDFRNSSRAEIVQDLPPQGFLEACGKALRDIVQKGNFTPSQIAVIREVWKENNRGDGKVIAMLKKNAIDFSSIL